MMTTLPTEVIPICRLFRRHKNEQTNHKFCLTLTPPRFLNGLAQLLLLEPVHYQFWGYQHEDFKFDQATEYRFFTSDKG